ncbi:prepilin peptidase [Streptomyces lonarensis]|nr:A24 family peptidase [Streptomyces lonarensis]
MSVPLIVAAAVYGAAAGALSPRGVYRLSVEPSQPWRPHCPQGHPWPRGARGWLGPASRCPACRRGPAAFRRADIGAPAPDAPTAPRSPVTSAADEAVDPPAIDPAVRPAGARPHSERPQGANARDRRHAADPDTDPGRGADAGPAAAPTGTTGNAERAPDLDGRTGFGAVPDAARRVDTDEGVIGSAGIEHRSDIDADSGSDTGPDAGTEEGTPDATRSATADAAPGAAERRPPRGLLPASVNAAVCALLASVLGAEPALAVWLLLVPGMVAVTAVDLAVLRLPDVLTYPLALLAVAGLGVCALVGGDAGGSWARALLAGGALAGALLVLALINPRGMGLGDVKLSLALGVALGWYGWDVLVLGVFAGFLLASVHAVHLVALRGAGRGTAFSMGPFLAAGALVGLVLAGLAG